MNKSRKIFLDVNYKPLPNNAGDEIYPNGIFNFSITRILENIASGNLKVEEEQINVSKWFETHMHGLINEEFLPKVDIIRPVIQAEIRPDMFEIIDGNHRMERAFREGLKFINSYKIMGEQLLPYFAGIRGYKAFVEYWNSKL